MTAATGEIGGPNGGHLSRCPLCSRMVRGVPSTRGSRPHSSFPSRCCLDVPGALKERAYFTATLISFLAQPNLAGDTHPQWLPRSPLETRGRQGWSPGCPDASQKPIAKEAAGRQRLEAWLIMTPCRGAAMVTEAPRAAARDAVVAAAAAREVTWLLRYLLAQSWATWRARVPEVAGRGARAAHLRMGGAGRAGASSTLVDRCSHQ